MPRGLFITGTGTSVGKTYVAALIARALRFHGKAVGVYKPVASGCELRDGRLVASDAEALWKAAVAVSEIGDGGLEGVRGGSPVSRESVFRIGIRGGIGGKPRRHGGHGGRRVFGNSAIEVGTDRRAVRYAAARPAVTPYHKQTNCFLNTPLNRFRIRSPW